MALPIKFLRNFPGMSRRLPSCNRREERIVLADVRGKIFKGAYSNYMHWLCNPIRIMRLALERSASLVMSADCKSAAFGHRLFKSTPLHQFFQAAANQKHP